MTQHVTELFSQWFDWRLDPAGRKDVDGHLASCAACRTYYEKMSNLFDASAAPGIAPDPFLPHRVRALAESASPEAPRKAQLSFAKLSLGALVLAIAVFAGVFIGSSASARMSTDQPSQDTALLEDTYTMQSFAEGWDDLITSDEDGEL